MNEIQAAVARAALLFAADKYRRAADVMARFQDPLQADVRASERNYRALAASINEFGSFDALKLDALTVAIAAATDDANRKQQLLTGRCQMQDAAVVEERVRELYEVAGIVATARGGNTNVPAPVEGHATEVIS